MPLFLLASSIPEPSKSPFQGRLRNFPIPLPFKGGASHSSRRVGIAHLFGFCLPIWVATKTVALYLSLPMPDSLQGGYCPPSFNLP